MALDTQDTLIDCIVDVSFAYQDRQKEQVAEGWL